MLIEARRSRLLLVDFQTRLWAAMMPEAAGVLARLALLITAAARLAIPIVVTRQYPQGLGPLLPELTVLLPADVRAQDKMSFSCCGNAEIASLLDDGRDQILIAGIETHVCVLQTAFDLAARGRAPFVLADACASRRYPDHAQALARLAQDGVRQASTESLVFEWLRSAEHAAFRDLVRAIRDLPKALHREGA